MNPRTLPKRQIWIYLIVGPTGKIYVGKSKSPYHRCYQYLRAIRQQNTDHINRHLLNAINKYGVTSFQMIAWEQCDTPARAAEREIHWMDVFNTTERLRGYNLRRDTSTGMEVHAETSALISANLRRQWGAGMRDGHAEKLRKSWVTRDRQLQGQLFSRIKTKWQYYLVIEQQNIPFDYRGLRALGLWSGAVTYFSRYKTDRAVVKGLFIRREQLNRAT